MYVNSTGIPHIFISPDPVEELFSCKDLIWRGLKTVEEFEFLRRHLHMSAVEDERVIRQIDLKTFIFHAFCLFFVVCI